jgi:hypothetical protein
MTRKKGLIRPRMAAAGSAALLALTTLMMPVRSAAFARTLRPASRQQYRAVNNSPDRWARVTASNMAASASACLAPGREAYLPLKSISGAYRAAYAEARCGEPEATGPPGGE